MLSLVYFRATVARAPVAASKAGFAAECVTVFCPARRRLTKHFCSAEWTGQSVSESEVAVTTTVPEEHQSTPSWERLPNYHASVSATTGCHKLAVILGCLLGHQKWCYQRKLRKRYDGGGDVETMTAKKMKMILCLEPLP